MSEEPSKTDTHNFDEEQFISDYCKFGNKLLPLFKPTGSPYLVLEHEDYPTILANKCTQYLLGHNFYFFPTILDYGTKQTSNPQIEVLVKNQFLLHPLFGAIREANGDLEKAKNNIGKSIKSYLKQWKGGNNNTKKHFALFNFKSEVNSIKLDDSICIKKLTDLERKKIRLTYTGSEFNNIKESDNFSYSIIDNKNDPGSPRRLKCLELALKLIKDGHLWTSGVIYINSYFGALNSTYMSFVDFIEKGNFNYHSSYITDYHLEKRDIYRLKNLYKKLTANDFRIYNALELAITRFLKAPIRQNNDDLIIDMTISLESYLLANTRDELKYRLSLRAVRLLKNEPKLSNFLKKLYDIRSNIAHNGKRFNSVRIQKTINESDYDKDFIWYTKDINRKLLIKTISKLDKLPKEYKGNGLLELFTAELDAEILNKIST